MKRQIIIIRQILAVALIIGFVSLTLMGCDDLFKDEEPTPSKKGNFSYTITWPDTVTAEITLQRLPELTDIALTPVSSAKVNGKNKTLSQTLELDAGNYFFKAIVSNDDLYDEVYEQIQVSAGKITVYTKTFNNDDLSPVNPINNTPITSADIVVIAPVKGAVPNTTANGAGNFTIGAVSWSPSPERFMGGTVYTVTVLLTANTGCTFTGLSSAKINGEDATVAYNNGSAALISYAFRMTEEVTFISNSFMVTPKNTKIYSYTYEGYDFYYIYLGQLANIPLYSFKTQIHDGIETEYTITVTDEVKNSVANTVSNSVQDAIKVATEHTESNTGGGKVGAEIAVQFGNPIVSAEVKVSAEYSWEKEITDTTTNTIEKTTSFSNTKEEATEYAKTNMESNTFHLTKEEPTGYYKYTMFGISDVYLYVISDPKTKEKYCEFKEFIIENAKDAYSWGFEYTKALPFEKKDASSFKLDSSVLDNLPDPEFDLSDHTVSNNFIVTNNDEWNRAIDIIKNGGSSVAANPNAYTITIRGNVGITGSITNTFGNAENIVVTLVGNGKLYLSSQGSLINIGGTQTICLDSASLTLQGLKAGENSSLLNNNRAIIYVNSSGKLELKNGYISGNITNTRAGGVHIMNGGVLTMTGGTISENTASTGVTDSLGNGGGVYVDNSTFTINGGTISGNNAINGGGVCVYNGSTFTMTGGTISENNASGSYGGVYIWKSDFTLAGGTISKNKALSNAGGVGLDSSGTLTMNGGNISENTATSGAGGVYVVSGTFTMNGGIISKNSAIYGGGVYVVTNGIFTMSGSSFINGNTATYGGGVRVSYGTFTMKGGTISGNRAYENGGGVDIPILTTFIKTGGTITGYGNDKVNGNMVQNSSDTFLSNRGHAVYVSYMNFIIPIVVRKENTSGPSNNLDASKSGSTGGWDN